MRRRSFRIFRPQKSTRVIVIQMGWTRRATAREKMRKLYFMFKFNLVNFTIGPWTMDCHRSYDVSLIFHSRCPSPKGFAQIVPTTGRPLSRPSNCLAIVRHAKCPQKSLARWWTRSRLSLHPLHCFLRDQRKRRRIYKGQICLTEYLYVNLLA